MRQKTALIIGAGPAGLTAAYELATRTNVKPIVFERSDRMGGIACTVNYKGNRIDIGGHRFFSKSDRVMDWWLQIMPLQEPASQSGTPAPAAEKYHGATTEQVDGDPDARELVMLLRERKSRIFFLRQFFDYPLRLSFDTLKKLGVRRVWRIGCSYLRSAIRPIKPEENLEQFFINRFGDELYRTFFKSYTEKVWGVECREIDSEWGAQRIKGLSMLKSLMHAMRTLAGLSGRDAAQKQTETSLIARFLYPKLGPGQLWDEVARRVQQNGGEIITQSTVREIFAEDNRVTGVAVEDAVSGEVYRLEGDYVISSMPIKDLVNSLQTSVPDNVREVANGLVYRDFLTVGLLLKRLDISDSKRERGELTKDNWIYIQEPGVSVGRIQIFNNWSPYLVADPSKVWVGLEYFCNQTDDLWKMADSKIIEMATREMETMGFIERQHVLDATVIRMDKAYPAYWGAYGRFSEVRQYVDAFANLFLVGRNGMHRYNNQDHAMLTAMAAVENILQGAEDKDDLWSVNVEQEWHERGEFKGAQTGAAEAELETAAAVSASAE